MQGIGIVILIVLRITASIIVIAAKAVFYLFRAIFRLCKKIYRKTARPNSEEIRTITFEELVKNELTR